jgi:hypothetical protein
MYINAFLEDRSGSSILNDNLKPETSLICKSYIEHLPLSGLNSSTLAFFTNVAFTFVEKREKIEINEGCQLLQNGAQQRNINNSFWDAHGSYNKKTFVKRRFSKMLIVE